jgi:hypothetical protein
MATIDLVERKNNVHRLSGTLDEWESGYWVIAEETAQRLVDGDLYLHSGQGEPSHFGGRILGWRVHHDGSEIDGRVVFRIRPSIGHKGMVTTRDGWGNDKKLVW